jgi:hypothetical protein
MQCGSIKVAIFWLLDRMFVYPSTGVLKVLQNKDEQCPQHKEKSMPPTPLSKLIFQTVGFPILAANRATKMVNNDLFLV